MKNKSYIKIGMTVAAFSVSSLSAEAQAKPNQVMWTDRTLTNPPLVEQRSIDGSMERFWNLPDNPNVAKSQSVKRPMHSRTSSVPARKSASMEQKREVRERRGFFGINLFNLIPLIDIVHGEVTTESLDSVEGKK